MSPPSAAAEPQCWTDPEAYLREVGGDDAARLDLAEAALALSALERPSRSIDHYRGHLAGLAKSVATHPLAASVAARDRVESLNAIILGANGYAGDRLTYDDLQNADLMRVIDRRKGLPIALCLLYLHVGRAQGWDLAGVGFPGHFLVRLDHAGERLVIDPFNEGRICEAADLRELLKAMAGRKAKLQPEHYAETSDREILVRLQNNIKLRRLQTGQPEKAAGVVETMLMFAPQVNALWREAGLLHAHTGNLHASISALETYLERETRIGPRHDAAALLQRLRSELN